MIIHPVILADPREAASKHLRTAIVDGDAHFAQVSFLLLDIWRKGDIALALYDIWASQRRYSRDHASIPQEMPHARA